MRPKGRARRLKVAALGLALWAPTIVRAAPTIAAGAYQDGLLLGYDPSSHEVSGYFSMEQGLQPSFSCIFYLKGALVGAQAVIETYYPETPKDDRIVGRLSLQGQGQVVIRLPEEHGGCWNVWHFADKDQPAAFTLDKAAPWRAVVVAKSARAYFYDAPAAASRRRAYVVKGDGLGVRAAERDWLEVDYVGGAKPLSGWIRRTDVYPIP